MTGKIESPHCIQALKEPSPLFGSLQTDNCFRANLCWNKRCSCGRLCFSIVDLKNCKAVLEIVLNIQNLLWRWTQTCARWNAWKAWSAWCSSCQTLFVVCWQDDDFSSSSGCVTFRTSNWTQQPEVTKLNQNFSCTTAFLNHTRE